MDFLLSSLRHNPDASYADLKAKADDQKLTIYPIMFGRAKTLLGLVKSAKRGTGKAAQKTAAAQKAKAGRPAGAGSKSAQIRELLGTGMSTADIAKKVGATTGLVYNVKSKMGQASKSSKRSPDRLRLPTPRRVATDSMSGLDSIVAAVRSGEQDRMRMRGALEKIQAVIADALS